MFCFFFFIWSNHFSFLKKFIYFLVIYFWLRWVFVAVHGLSLVAVREGYSLLWCTGFSLQWLLLLWSMGSRCTGFSSCGTRAQQLWCTGLAALWHVGSSRTRARTRVPCIGRQIINHCATREVSVSRFLFECIPHLWRAPSLEKGEQHSSQLQECTLNGIFNPPGHSDWFRCSHMTPTSPVSVKVRVPNWNANILSLSEWPGWSSHVEQLQAFCIHEGSQVQDKTNKQKQIRQADSGDTT